MTRIRMLAFGAALGGAFMVSSGRTASSAGNPPSENRENLTTELFHLMGRNTIWTLVDDVTVNWPTFHTQGMVKIGENFYVSSVQVISSTVRNGTVTDALYDFSIDRSPGAGRGWLSKFNAAGQLLGQIELTHSRPSSSSPRTTTSAVSCTTSTGARSTA